MEQAALMADLAIDARRGPDQQRVTLEWQLRFRCLYCERMLLTPDFIGDRSTCMLLQERLVSLTLARNQFSNRVLEWQKDIRESQHRCSN
jgi:hypothetical protein